MVSSRWVLCAVGRFDEHITLAVLEDMRTLVEKGEPEEVISFTSEAELKDGFGRGKPTGRAIGASGRELGNENDRDANGTAKLSRAGRKPPARRL